jgi:hypothetical protein
MDSGGVNGQRAGPNSLSAPLEEPTRISRWPAGTDAEDREY